MERQWATIPEVCNSLLSRSGFSANLAHNSFATSARLPESRHLKAGNELFTEAPGIPTTTSPTGQVCRALRSWKPYSASSWKPLTIQV